MTNYVKIHDWSKDVKNIQSMKACQTSKLFHNMVMKHERSSWKTKDKNRKLCQFVVIND
jgi:hypothetical protein